jgi:hypothetical protein
MPPPLIPPEVAFLPFRGIENDVSHFLRLDPVKTEIRCVRLASGSGKEPLICYLEHTTLSSQLWVQKLSYEALSYC